MLSFSRIPQQLQFHRFIYHARVPSVLSAPPTCCAVLPDMERYREAFANKMEMAGIKPHHRIALGVSGGADSMSLCVLAAGWKKCASREEGKMKNADPLDGLLGIIIDHKLRPESTEEAKWVSNRVTKMGIQCEIASCNWSDQGMPKQGQLEEAARHMRYQIFQNVCSHHQIGILLVAHHADDQAELLVLRLSRNSGVLGLAGMAFISQIFPKYVENSSTNSSHSGILLVRPTLEFSKEDMYQICLRDNQEWVEDPTNQSLLFSRNRIRSALKNLVGTCKSELQALVAACRLTRSYVDQVCHDLIEKSVVTTELGYAIIDLEKLKPSDVEDLCLTKFLTHVLQFISQKHRPVRGSVLKQLLIYIRSIPCKTALTAAGCYVCAAPGSKGKQVLVTLSPDCPQPSSSLLYQTFSCSKLQHYKSKDIDEILLNAKVHSLPLINSSDVRFLSNSSSILDEAKKLNIISEDTHRTILSLQMEEKEYFNAKADMKYELDSKHEMSATSLTIPLYAGQTLSLMSRFLVSWEVMASKNWINTCNCMPGSDLLPCLVMQENVAFVRLMVEADWLCVARLAEKMAPQQCQQQEISSGYNFCSEHSRTSAQKALGRLKSVPASARRALPVLTDSQGLLVCIPSVSFQRCPCISVEAVFQPQVPLGGGFSSYI